MAKSGNNSKEEEIKISNQGGDTEPTQENPPELPEDVKHLHSKIYASPEAESPEIKSPEMGFKGFSMGSPRATSPPPPPPPSPGLGPEKHPESQIIHRAPKPKIHLWLYLASSIFVLLLAIAGISLYKGDIYWIRDLLGFGLPKDPIKAIEKVNQNMSKVKTYKNSIDAKLNFSLDQDKLSGTLTGNGETDKANGGSKLNLKIKDVAIPETLLGGTKIDTKTIEKSLDFSIVTTKNEIYFKTPLLDDKWHKVNLTNLIAPDKLSNVNENEASKGVPQLLSAVIYSEGVEKTGIEEFSKYVKSAQKLNDEKVNEEGAYHYSYEMDLIKTLEEDENFKKMPDFQKEVLKNFLSKYITLKADAWVSKKNLLFAKEKVSLDVKINGEDFGGSGILKFNVELSEEYKDIDKSVSIEKPKDAIDFDVNKFIGSFYQGGIPGGSSASINDARRKADLKQIQAALEMYAEDNKGAYPALTDDSRDGSFLAILQPKYLSKVPIDPAHPNYYYKYESDGKKHKLTCVLENQNDPEGKKSGGLNIYTVEGP